MRGGRQIPSSLKGGGYLRMAHRSYGRAGFEDVVVNKDDILPTQPRHPERAGSGLTPSELEVWFQPRSMVNCIMIIRVRERSHHRDYILGLQFNRGAGLEIHGYPPGSEGDVGIGPQSYSQQSTR